MLGRWYQVVVGGYRPRRARPGALGTLQHAIVRGIEKRRIVDDRWDRGNFVSRLLYTQSSKDICKHAEGSEALKNLDAVAIYFKQNVTIQPRICADFH